MVAAIAHIRPGNENLLRVGPAAVDVSAASLPVTMTESATHGGWTVVTSGTCARTCGLVRLDQKDGLPLTPQSAVAAAAPTRVCFNSTECVQPGLRVPFRPAPAIAHGLRLQSAPGGGFTTMLNGQLKPTVQATAVEPARQYVLRGFARTNGVGKLRFECNFLTFGGAPSADPLARNALTIANASYIGWHETSVWEPLLLRLVSPGDAAFVRVGATVEDGAVLDLFGVWLS